MLIHILRHGETTFNKLGIVQGSGVDTDLNETGLEQAQAFYNHYKDLDFQLVVTSALKRTHQTVASFIAAGIPWVQTPDINEISWGEHEGIQSTPETMATYHYMINEWQSGNLHAAIPGGESAHQLSERLQRFIDWLHTRPADRLLVCSHGRTMRALITLLKAQPLTTMEGTRHVNTGCYIAKLQDGQFIFEAENSVEHLNGILV
jgi:broad specificity phosphatase PhoE